MVASRSGPVRSRAAHEAILDAAAAMLRERGYDGLTIEGVATQAGVGKQTIYRWWPDKGALIAECMVEGRLTGPLIEPPDTGDIRADLTVWLRDVAAFLAQGDHGGSMMRTLIAAAAGNAEVGRRLKGSPFGPVVVARRLARAVGTTPTLTPGTSTEAVADALIGAIVIRELTGDPLDEAFVEDLVEGLLGPSPGA